MLTIEDIHKAKDFLESEVDVPEWGGKVMVRTLSMASRYSISEQSMVEKGKSREVDTIKFAAGTLEHGLVSPKMTAGDALKVVREHSPEPIQKLVDEIWRLSVLKEAVAKNG